MANEALDFVTPKPTRLIQRILQIATNPGDLVLDSFAGSGTTGHAVLKLNQAQSGLAPRRFILVEMEPAIARAITAERLTRAVNGYHDQEGLGGGFHYCTLGPTLFDAEGQIRPEVGFDDLARHVFFVETGEPRPARNGRRRSPFLGAVNGVGVYLLYNGILADKSPEGGNVLTRAVLADLPPHPGPKVIYGAGCRLAPERLVLAQEERAATGEYLRPILLVQAQPRRQGQQTLSVEVVRSCLIEDHRIPIAQIARATGEDNEIEGVDLADPKCEIRYIITVQALREGWDCPSAYVLCSVAELRSSTAVEQILGRVMRLPGAARKAQEDLNRAYAFAVSANFGEAANALTDALVENGFNRQEAKDFITIMPPVQPPLPETIAPPVSRVILPEPPDLGRLPAITRQKVTYEPGTGELTFNGVMLDNDREALYTTVGSAAGRNAIEHAYRQSRGQPLVTVGAPAERGEVFAIPVLALRQGDLLEAFEATHFLEQPWQLSKQDARLTKAEYSPERSTSQQGEITLTHQGRVEARFLMALQSQMALLATDQGWTIGELAYWLDRAIPHPDIVPAETGLFLTRALRCLIDERGYTLDQLVHDKYRLKQALAAKIDQHRRRAHQAAYQALLLPESATPLTVTPERCFAYDPAAYPYSRPYQGAYQFQKHYYPQVGDLEAQGEESQCAQFIDLLPKVKYWVRNLERRPEHAFWLQTATDRFYPDFVCQLHDGRYVVVEYKGQNLWSNDDSKEKRAIGELWAARSGGRCRFVMPHGKDFEAIRAATHN